MIQHSQENVKENPKTEGNIKEKETKHKITPSCLNNCIKWELQAKVQMTKDETVINSYQGNSYYFRKLDASILNILQNNSAKTNSNIQCTMKHLISTSKNELKAKTSNQNSLPDIMKIKFPIDNTSFNFMIIDANLGNKDNLNNIFFLEFNLNTNNAGKIRDIDDNCVEKEILFNLNAMFHDSKLFKSDLTFSVEYRKFIKSIQFKLQSYKNQIANKIKYSNNKHQKNQYRKNDNNHHQNNQICFYAKILSNINIGIEFSKPIFDEFELFHTNFNSIVNSNIKINKIYLEVSIPNIFIEGKNLNLGKMKIKQIVSNDNNNKQEDIVIKEKDSKVEDLNSLNIEESIKSSAITENSSIFSKQYPNDFDRILYKQHNSPTLTIRNNFSINLNYSNHNFYGSPLFTMKPIKNINNSNTLYSPLSSMGIANPYYMNMLNPNGIGAMSPNERKFSENVYDKLRENPLSSINQQIPSFYNTPTQVMMRTNNEEFGIPPSNRLYSSPKVNRNPMIIGINNSNLSFNPKTIHKRIIDWENKGNDYHNNNNMLIMQQNIQQNQKLDFIEMANKKNFIEFYQNKTNLEIFLNTVRLNIKNYCDKGDFTLFSYFSNFKLPSLFGVKINYLINSEIVTLVYFLTLSSMTIVIKNNNTREKVISYLISIGKMKNKEEVGEYIIIIKNIQIIINKESIYIIYTENKPYHFRMSLMSQIDSILSTLPVLKSLSFDEIEGKESFFSVLYSPIKHSKSQYSNNTSFVLFYPLEISITQQSIQSQYCKMMLIGLLPIKFDTKFFFSRVGLNQFSTIIDNSQILLINLISNVQEKIIDTSTWNSLDYEQFIKTNGELIYNKIL